MSLIPIGLTVALAAADNLISPFFQNQASIGGIVPDVSIEQHHVDELTVTDQPVEQGADVSDNAYKRPVSCTIRAGWSNSSSAALGDPGYVDEIYQQLLTLQASRQPFDIVTTKRKYQNMLITKLQTSTDRRSAYSMIVVADCREVIIVSTQTVTVPSAANQQNPQLNGATTNTGAQTLQPAPNYNPANALASGIAPL